MYDSYNFDVTMSNKAFEFMQLYVEKYGGTVDELAESLIDNGLHDLAFDEGYEIDILEEDEEDGEDE